MKNREMYLSFYEQIDNLIPAWDNDLQRKMEFARDYMNIMTIKNLENKRISIGPMDERTLQFLIFSILLEYDSVKEPEKPKRIEKDTFYLDAEEIFPIEDMTLEEVEFIKHCLDKVHVDIESDDEEVIVLDTKQIFFLLTGIMREYNIFLENGRKFEE
jgi:hypothetical protein